MGEDSRNEGGLSKGLADKGGKGCERPLLSLSKGRVGHRWVSLWAWRVLPLLTELDSWKPRK